MHISKSIFIGLSLITLACNQPDKAKQTVCPNITVLNQSEQVDFLIKSNADIKSWHQFLDSYRDQCRKNQKQIVPFYFMDSLITPLTLNKIEWMDDPNFGCGRRNIIDVLLNRSGKILIEGYVSSTSDVFEFWLRHLSNNGKNPNLSDAPNKAFAQISTDSIFPMDTLATIITQIQLAHHNYIRTYAEEYFHKPFCELPLDTIQYLKEEYPLRIIYSRRRENMEVPEPPAPLVSEEKE